MSNDAFGSLLEEVFGDVGRRMQPDFERIGLAGPPLNPPSRTETAAVAIMSSKTAALCYDRVWSPIVDLPRDLGFFCGSRSEHAVVTLSLLISVMGGMVRGGESHMSPQLKRHGSVRKHDQ
jgi:hypothetical protein